MPYCASCGTQAAEGQIYCTTCGKAVAAPMPPLEAMPYFPADNIQPIQGYAGFWWRVLAYVIDVIILGIVVAIIGSAAKMSADSRVVLAVILAFVSGTAFIATRSQTWGMMITRLRVEGVDGAKVTWNQAAIRTAFYSALLLVADLSLPRQDVLAPDRGPAATRSTQSRDPGALRTPGVVGQSLDAVGQAQADHPRQGRQDRGEALSK